MIFETLILNMYKDNLYQRCDDEGTAFYFSAADFPGLHVQPYDVTAAGGHTLRGWLYRYEVTRPNRLIVFDHGFGGGHRSYMKEIDRLCRAGYRVFAYDHTGCMESGGDTPNGMGQALCDLNDVITAIKADRRFLGLQLSVMGHSWGGYAAANIPALHPDIRHVVVLSGFVSVATMVGASFGGLLKGYRKPILELERRSSGKFVDYDAVTALTGAETKALLIYSDNDKELKSVQYETLLRGLADRKNVRLLLVHDKGHNPNYTTDAVRYLKEYSRALKKNMKRRRLETAEAKAAFVARWDWNRMTAQDDAIWAEILGHLDT